MKNRQLRVVIMDDGKGMTQEKLEYVRQSLELEESIGRSSSIGLNNVNERCQLFFGDSFKMEIESERGVGTRVTLITEIVNWGGQMDDKDCSN